MPHVVLCLNWNPQVSCTSGIAHLLRQLYTEHGVNLWSVGFERNPSWQMLDPERIILIPYVVRPSLSKEQLQQKSRSTNTNNFVFYAGDSRVNAIQCGRDAIAVCWCH